MPESKYWPDPEGMCRELEEMGIKPIVSIWPTINPKSENFHAMSEGNMLVRTENGQYGTFDFYGQQTFIDTMNPDTCAFVWDRVKENYYDKGIKNFWLDEAEPEVHPQQFAVILLFAVFVDDWNLQERLRPVGEAYGLPMVSIRDAVVEQFYKKPAEGRGFSKNQFFYDCYHPSNLGHTVMADCLLYLLQTVDQMPEEEDTLKLGEIMPPLGGEFEKVRFFDRSSHIEGISVDCGSFCHCDKELQAVEMDMDLEPTDEFPFNWMYRGETEAGECRPFSMSLDCSALLLIFKDSGSSSFGRAKVWVDGREVLTADPHVNGWTHCNPVICIRQSERRRHQVEIRMDEGEQEKAFTILGFGYVE